MGRNDFHSDGHLVAAVDAVHATTCRVQRELLSLIVEVDRRESWRDSGARDTAHWLSMRYGISCWKAHRWVAAAHALDGLPRVSDALARGELGLDKVIELTRFASPGTEADLVSWAKRVSCATVRRRGDLERRASIEEDLDAERSRFVSWWYFDEGRRLGLEAELPAAQGAIVVRAIERVAEAIPAMPQEGDDCFAPARRADALVALCSTRIACDTDQDRATVVVHAQLEGLERGAGGCEIEGGPAVHPETVRRLLCNARVQTVLEDQVPRVRRATVHPGPPRPVVAARGSYGPGQSLADLLVPSPARPRARMVKRDPDGTVRWFLPGGALYRAGPSPGHDADERLLIAAAG